MDTLQLVPSSGGEPQVCYRAATRYWPGEGPMCRLNAIGLFAGDTGPGCRRRRLIVLPDVWARRSRHAECRSRIPIRGGRPQAWVSRRLMPCGHNSPRHGGVGRWSCPRPRRSSYGNDRGATPVGLAARSVRTHGMSIPLQFCAPKPQLSVLRFADEVERVRQGAVARKCTESYCQTSSCFAHVCTPRERKIA